MTAHPMQDHKGPKPILEGTDAKQGISQEWGTPRCM